MFTGIIEEVGIVSQLTKLSTGALVKISCKKVLEDFKIGESMAVNGVCLTVRDIRKDSLIADIMPETLRSTNLGSFFIGEYVNLEKALKTDGRFGGHMVLGHIDGTGKIIKNYSKGNAKIFQITCSEELMKYIVLKGSVAIDGISLTVQSIENQGFTVSMIPHTLKATTLQYRSSGDTVNIETDIIGKYIRKFLLDSRSTENPSKEVVSKGLTIERLRSYGFSS
ncbi:MAG: riboflavin synthase [Candidatus Caldatribacteriota bacterium]|nr:riboflavin synthase [Candidatus Caldatribacteriota bacterium]